MKTYDEVIEKMGKAVWNSYMGGAMNEFEVAFNATWAVAYIYERDEKDVQRDVQEVFRRILHGNTGGNR